MPNRTPIRNSNFYTTPTHTVPTGGTSLVSRVNSDCPPAVSTSKTSYATLSISSMMNVRSLVATNSNNNNNNNNNTNATAAAALATPTQRATVAGGGGTLPPMASASSSNSRSSSNTIKRSTDSTNNNNNPRMFPIAPRNHNIAIRGRTSASSPGILDHNSGRYQQQEYQPRQHESLLRHEPSPPQHQPSGNNNSCCAATADGDDDHDDDQHQQGRATNNMMPRHQRPTMLRKATTITMTRPMSSPPSRIGLKRTASNVSNTSSNSSSSSTCCCAKNLKSAGAGAPPILMSNDNAGSSSSRSSPSRGATTTTSSSSSSSSSSSALAAAAAAAALVSNNNNARSAHKSALIPPSSSASVAAAAAAAAAGGMMSGKKKSSNSKKSKRASSNPAASKGGSFYKALAKAVAPSDFVDTSKFIDKLWPRTSQTLNNNSNQRQQPVVFESAIPTHNLKSPLLPDNSSKISRSTSAPAPPLVPMFLHRNQVDVPGSPLDIEHAWLSDSPFDYRTAGLVFPPADLKRMPDGRRETKQSNASMERPVVVPPPLRKYWRNKNSNRKANDQLVPTGGEIPPAIHSQLHIMLSESERAATQLLDKDRESIYWGQQQQQQQPQNNRKMNEQQESDDDDNNNNNNNASHHVLFRRAHSGLHRRVKRQGPNLGHMTFFYSPTAARSSPALSVIRAAGLSEDLTATHNNVRSANWTLWWAKGVTSAEMALMDGGQKVNHFPGSWAIGRKDNLNRHLMAQLRKYGSDIYGFFPKGYLLPRDRGRLRTDMKAAKAAAKIECREYKQLLLQKQEQDEALEKLRALHHHKSKKAKEQQGNIDNTAEENVDDDNEDAELMSSLMNQLITVPEVAPRKSPLYIFKRVAGACGRGMRVISKMPCGAWGSALVQEYIDRPLLVNGYKFDLRIYVVVTSYNPLRVYIYREGLARFATSPYPVGQNANTTDRTAHLTNFSVNRKTDGACAPSLNSNSNNVKTNKSTSTNNDADALPPRMSKTSSVVTFQNQQQQQKQQQQQQQQNVDGEEDDDDCDDEEVEEDLDEDNMLDEQEMLDEMVDDHEEEEEDDDNASAAGTTDDDEDDEDDENDGGNAVPKWTFEMLHSWFDGNLPKGSWDDAWSRIDDVIIKTLLSCENAVSTAQRHIRPRERYPTCFFELFGFDVLLKSNLDPVLMEVNIMCSLESRCSPLDQHVKANMMADMFSLVGVVPLGRQNRGPTPDPAVLAPSQQQVVDNLLSLLKKGEEQQLDAGNGDSFPTTTIGADNNNHNSLPPMVDVPVVRTAREIAATANNLITGAYSSFSSSSSPPSTPNKNSRRNSFTTAASSSTPTTTTTTAKMTPDKDNSTNGIKCMLVQRAKALHQQVHSFWTNLAHPQLVDVIAYTEEERIRKGETFRRAYPPELGDAPGYYVSKYSDLYAEHRVADATLAQWHALQCEAHNLLTRAAAVNCSNINSTGGGVAHRDVLNLLCDAKQLSPWLTK